MNIFSNEYAKQKVFEFPIKDNIEEENIKVVMKTIQGRCDEYLNISFLNHDYKTPVFYINERLWMSLSPMEIQAQEYPLWKAEGYVGGLGLGYFVYEAMKNNVVEEIDVYEQELSVINYFKKYFKDCKGFDKVNFIHGDVRELMQNKEYNFVYMDIYERLCDDITIKDYVYFMETNKIDKYTFFGEEKIMFEALCTGDLLPDEIDWSYREFFGQFMKSGKENMVRQNFDTEFIEKYIEINNRYNKGD